ncbi:CoA transferase [Frankia sp. Cas3]|uniref:CaiB/BaiF CoA transferase family protein n=1 Tax=Frankia sp. Cas3 TaxID=3073926 RepID=UPI002AD39863|nr:CoA transferase [Frankia sp. Cas3]
MSDVMAGVRVVEVAAWTFVPAAGAVLADWGADVIKIEHPETGDPQRGLVVGNVGAKDSRGINFLVEQPNRGKRSLALDIASEQGRELLLKLIGTADVFLTNLLADSLARLRLTVEDVRAANPNIIYARGTGQGIRGPDAQRGGFDSASYWSRGGIAAALTEPAAPWPPLQRPAFGDIMGGLTIAAGIAAALFKRERTGEPAVTDVSLLSTATWNLAPDVVAAGLLGSAGIPRFDVDDMPNPLTNYYRTSDGRYLNLVMLQSDRFWPEFATLVGRPDLIDDPRFKTAADRFTHRRACITEIRSIFSARPLAEWRETLSGLEGVWAAVQTAGELHQDPQVVENGYLRPVEADDGSTFSLVASPIQFDETPPDLRRAPEHGQHTEEICLELGLGWEEIIALKEAGALL